MSLKVCCISDTHMSHRDLKMPPADILVHTGDYAGVGKLQELFELNEWFGSLDGLYSEIFLVPGNHDRHFESYDFASSVLTNAVVLFNRMVEFRGYKIYGSPYTKTFYNWYFMKDPEELKEEWKKIPDEVDILLTHQPPYMILDSVFDKEKNVGCPYLRQEVLTRIKPKLHVYGHLHKDGGKWVEHNGTIFVNAAMNNDNYIMNREPILIEL